MGLFTPSSRKVKPRRFQYEPWHFFIFWLCSYLRCISTMHWVANPQDYAVLFNGRCPRALLTLGRRHAAPNRL